MQHLYYFTYCQHLQGLKSYVILVRDFPASHACKGTPLTLLVTLDLKVFLQHSVCLTKWSNLRVVFWLNNGPIQILLFSVSYSFYTKRRSSSKYILVGHLEIHISVNIKVKNTFLNHSNVVHLCHFKLRLEIVENKKQLTEM